MHQYAALVQKDFLGSKSTECLCSWYNNFEKKILSTQITFSLIPKLKPRNEAKIMLSSSCCKIPKLTPRAGLLSIAMPRHLQNHRSPCTKILTIDKLISNYTLITSMVNKTVVDHTFNKTTE